MSREELDRIWGFIKEEAKSLADCEPLLASFF
ncbi:Serine acetyltransferase [Providencia stuartii]|nr:Serine acetyltransferase [Providencia stuartii]